MRLKLIFGGLVLCALLLAQYIPPAGSGAAVTHIIAGGTSPAIASGFGSMPSIVGKDSAFKVTVGAGGGNSGVVTFGAVWAVAPVCVVITNGTALSTDGAIAITVASSTSAVTFTGTRDDFAAGVILNALCIGY